MRSHTNLNTLVRVYETGMLTGGRKAALVRASDRAEAEKLLNDMKYFRFAKSEDALAAVSEEELGWIRLAKIEAGETFAAEYFALPRMVRNLKILSQSGRADAFPVPDGLYDGSDYEAWLSGTAQPPVATAPLFAAAKAVSGESRIQIDRVLNRAYWETASHIARLTGDPDVSALTKARIDLHNLSVLLQCRAAGIPVPAEAAVPGGTLNERDPDFFAREEREEAICRSPYGDLWKDVTADGGEVDFETRAEAVLMQICKRAKLQPFGVFPAYAFWHAKFAELRFLRTVLAGFDLGLPRRISEERAAVNYEL